MGNEKTTSYVKIPVTSTDNGFNNHGNTIEHIYDLDLND